MSHDISHLRAAIDAIDDEIVQLLNERSLIVKQVGMTKKRRQKEGMAFIRSGREAEVVRRIYTKLAEGVFPAAAAAAMWRLVICASLSLESDLTLSVDNSGGDRLYWLAREYFGSFTPLASRSAYTEVIEDIRSGKAEAGIFSGEFGTAHARWWVSLPQGIKLFACIPFMLNKDEKIGAFAVANIEPENTGQDITFLRIIGEEDFTVNALVPLTADILDKFLLPSGKYAFLVSVQGFITEIPLLKNVETSVIGAYAVPLILT